ncbi:MAG: acyl carrier protein [Thermodesulfovibrionales bacterium]
MAQNIVTEEKVIEEVKKAVAETLSSDAAAIQPDNSMIRDLGAESLDFLDINYRLEQAFGIKMARHFILEHIEEMFGEGTAIDENGQLTEKAVRFLQARYGDSFPGFKQNMDMDEVPSLFTIRTMAGGVLDILDTLPEKCTQCGNAAWKSDNGVKIICGSCGEQAVFTNGDDLIKQWLTKIQDDKKIC